MRFGLCGRLPCRRDAPAPRPSSRRVIVALTRAAASRQRAKTVHKTAAIRNSHAVEEAVAASKIGASGATVSITDEQLAGTARAPHAGCASEGRRVCGC